MTSGVTAQIRLVRCPICHLLLPEPPEFTVYQCGGCDAVLQAISRKTDISSLASGEQSNCRVETSESDHVPDDKDVSTTSNDASFPSSCESLPYLNHETEQMQSDNQDHLKPVNLPYLTDEMERIESDDQCSARPVNSNSSCNLKNEIESIQSENGPTTLEDDVAEEELSETERMQSDNQDHLKPVNLPYLNGEMERIESDDQCSARLVNSNCSCTLKNEIESIQSENGPTTLEDDVAEEELSETERMQSDNQDHLKPVNLPYLNSEMERIECDDHCSARLVNSNCSCNLKNEIESIQFENEPTTLEDDVAEEELSDENLQLGEVKDEGISSQIHPCSSPEQPEQPHDLEDTELEHNASELNEALLDSPLYSARNFLADDGSIFSDDEELDHISDHYRHSSLNVHKASVDDLHEEESAVENKLLARNMTSEITELEMELRRRSCRSNSSANNGYDINGGKQDHDDFLECYTKRLYRRSSQNCNGNVNIAYSELNDFRSDRFLDPEEEKMNILRLVYQMQKQLNKSSNFDSDGSRFVSGPLTWKTPREGILRNPYHSENLRRYPHVGYQPRQHKYSRISFSGEASSSGSQIDQASYFHPHQHGMQRSMPLYPGLLRFHPNDSSYSHCSSIPHSCLSSQYSLTQQEPIFSNQRKNQEVDEYSRERYRLAKRHFRPIAGGAPFISCYNCFKPLHIPADFLLFKRRRHKLRCGACSEVLEFIIQSRNLMIPCMDPPPSQNDKYSDEQDRASASYAAGHPMSFSDDYVPVGDPSSGSNVADSRNSSDNHNSKQIKEFGLKQSQRTSKNPVKSHQPSVSPLHKLMGYSSISQVINRSGQ